MGGIPAGAWLSVVVVAMAFAGQDSSPGTSLARHEYVETHMAVPFKILLYTSDPAAARRASRAAFERVESLNKTLSDYDPESELSRLSRSAGGSPQKVGDDLFDVLTRSQEMHRRSAGAFDVTIAPVGRLWRRARRDHKLPDPTTLAQARTLVGGDKLHLDPQARTVQLAVKGMKLDVGGIAKGYAAGAALEVLKKHGITRALVASAGDIVVGDSPPGSNGWRVAIAPLDPTLGRPYKILLLKNAAVSTAGDAEQFVVIDGHRYSHIIDPRTGMGVEDRASVTVVAPDGATADALETTVYLMGPERGLALIDQTPGTSAVFLRQTQDGVKAFESARFKDVPTLETSLESIPRGGKPAD